MKKRPPWLPGYFVRIPVELYDDTRLCSYERDLYCLLARYCGRNDHCKVLVSTICRKMKRMTHDKDKEPGDDSTNDKGLGDSTVRELTASLVAKGWLKKQKRARKSSLYSLLNPYSGDTKNCSAENGGRATPSMAEASSMSASGVADMSASGVADMTNGKKPVSANARAFNMYPEQVSATPRNVKNSVSASGVAAEVDKKEKEEKTKRKPGSVHVVNSHHGGSPPDNPPTGRDQTQPNHKVQAELAKIWAWLCVTKRFPEESVGVARHLVEEEFGNLENIPSESVEELRTFCKALPEQLCKLGYIPQAGRTGEIGQ